MVRSGKEYHLFRRFLEKGAIAPDLPELRIPNQENPRETENIDAQINRARTLRDWALGKLENIDEMPSVEIGDYNDVPNRSYHGIYLNSAYEILWGIEDGSLIYVPNPSFLGEGLFGEIAPRLAPRIRIPGSGKMATFSFNGRRLWNIKNLPMRELPDRLLELKKIRVGITSLRRDDKIRLYRQYYGSFIVEGSVIQSEIQTESENFSATDATIISALSNMIQENLDRNAVGNSDMVSIHEAAFIDLGDDAFQIHVDIQSPGEFQISSESIGPIVLKAFFALALAVGPADLKAQVDTNGITISNSLSDGEGLETEPIRSGVHSLLTLIGADDLEETIRLIRVFNERTGGNVDASVTR
jgi:hypothetical protein